MSEKTYSIGEVVRLLNPDVDVTESSLRFWEKMGLLCSRRTPGGHRVYTEEDLNRIRIIKRLQTQRYMPLEKIRRLCQSVPSNDELAAIAEFNESFYRPLRYDPSFEPLTQHELAARTGLAPQTLAKLQDAGALRPVSEIGAAPEAAEAAAPRYDEDGLRIAEIFQELSRFGVEPEDFREACELTVRLVELQFRYYFEKIYPNLPKQQEAARVKVLNDLGQELMRIIYHQTYLSVGARLTREGEFDRTVAEKSQEAKKAKTP